MERDSRRIYRCLRKYKMKVLTIGSDRKLFEEQSPVVLRSLDYANKMEELHIIVFSLKKHNLKEKKINNLYIYPTSSSSKFCYIKDAYYIGKRVIKENKFIRGLSVISTQDPFESGLVGLFLKKKFNLPLQVQLHTDMWSSHFSNSFLNIIRRIISSYVLKKVDGVRTVTKDLAEKMTRKLSSKAKVSILPIFVDIDYIKNQEPIKDLRKDFPQFDFIILMASRLTSEKRIDVALHILKNILPVFPKVGLVIAGNGNEENNLKNIAKNIGISNNVIFLGWQNDLISLYKTSNIFLLTSEYEGYGMTVIESLASGCPVFATKVGVVSEIIEDGKNSYICNVGDVDCFVLKIINYIRDNSKRELLKINIGDSIDGIIGKKDKYISQYVAILEDLLPKNEFKK